MQRRGSFKHYEQCQKAELFTHVCFCNVEGNQTTGENPHVHENMKTPYRQTPDSPGL